ncbi:MAG: hypothetical protein ACR2K2_03835 [Mycobacteriales bacterium]
MPAPFWIARLLISARTVEKISSKHGLGPNDVTDAVTCQVGLRAVLDKDPDRGPRFFINVDVAGVPATIVLRAVEHDVDVYVLVSAYRR